MELVNNAEKAESRGEDGTEKKNEDKRETQKRQKRKEQKMDCKETIDGMELEDKTEQIWEQGRRWNREREKESATSVFREEETKNKDKKETQKRSK